MQLLRNNIYAQLGIFAFVYLTSTFFIDDNYF